MRLVEVEIENYKQYAGTHVFRPGEKAMVAIVGHNGAGKTTLFEAIEWCLYNPTRIKNDSLTPRVQGGKPRVRVVLEDPHSGIVYEIERLLKGGSTQAEIYRQDQPESPLVQGTKQVTDYVTKELTGLSHTAFVSTFFTRQKELSLFRRSGRHRSGGSRSAGCLGSETIRVAQKRIGEQRTRKQAEARVKREQFEEQSSGIDFPAERERLDGVISEQTVARDTARSTEAALKAGNRRGVGRSRPCPTAIRSARCPAAGANQGHGEQQRVCEMRECGAAGSGRHRGSRARDRAPAEHWRRTSRHCAKRSNGMTARSRSSMNVKRLTRRSEATARRPGAIAAIVSDAWARC